MGGTSSLIFTRYTKHPVTACLANCPAADVTWHYTERPDLPRTFHSAFYGYKGPFQQILKEHSPLHQAAKMPRIPYLIVAGSKDSSVSQKKHADPLVRALRKHKHNVEYLVLPEMGHCGPLPHAVAEHIREFVVSPFSNELPF
jgi:dipeptidyl aminopeptidase/acylaminoacyl peptidase